MSLFGGFSVTVPNKLFLICMTYLLNARSISAEISPVCRRIRKIEMCTNIVYSKRQLNMMPSSAAEFIWKT